MIVIIKKCNETHTKHAVLIIWQEVQFKQNYF